MDIIGSVACEIYYYLTQIWDIINKIVDQKHKQIFQLKHGWKKSLK